MVYNYDQVVQSPFKRVLLHFYPLPLISAPTLTQQAPIIMYLIPVLRYACVYRVYMHLYVSIDNSLERTIAQFWVFLNLCR